MCLIYRRLDSNMSQNASTRKGWSYLGVRVSDVLRVNNPDRATATDRSSSPLPACQLRQHRLRLSALRAGTARNGTANGPVRPAESGSADKGSPADRRYGTSVRRKNRRLTYRNRPRWKMSPVSSLGKVVDSHNPQRVGISERASAARGAMQLAESSEQTC